MDDDSEGCQLLVLTQTFEMLSECLHGKFFDMQILLNFAKFVFEWLDNFKGKSSKFYDTNNLAVLTAFCTNAAPFGNILC